MKAILKKNNCLVAIGERPREIIDDAKWNKIDGNIIVDLYLVLADELYSSMKEKRKYRILSQNCMRPSQLIINLMNNNQTDSLVFNDVTTSVLN